MLYPIMQIRSPTVIQMEVFTAFIGSRIKDRDDSSHQPLFLAINSIILLNRNKKKHWHTS